MGYVSASSGLKVLRRMPAGRMTSDSTSAANRCLPATSPTYPAIEMLGFEYEKVRPGSV